MLFSTPSLGQLARPTTRDASLREGQASHQASHGRYRGHIDGTWVVQHDNGHQFSPYRSLKELTMNGVWLTGVREAIRSGRWTLQ